MRHFALHIALAATLAGLTLSAPLPAAETIQRPNVLLIMTDDQGYGDFGFHGNPVVETPNLDKLAAESVEFTRFYVSPVCSPTRSSLLTGRYNYRTGVVDTYKGRSMMRPGEVTLAEALGAEGYRTGIVGKWHLGDNYPLRPMDQGFAESLVHKGGGIGQASDPAGGESYFDAILQRDGKPEKTKGYCTEVYGEAARDFIRRHAAEPFFLYLAFNAPHTPLEVPDDELRAYRQADLSPGAFPDKGRKFGEGADGYDPKTAARVYAMVGVIDREIGRTLATIDELKLRERTIVLFLTDNGPQQPRYNAGLRGLKGTPYEGGIRTPLLVRWPGRVESGRKIDTPAAHIDLTPTLLEACAVAAPGGVKMDGVSLLPLIEGKPPAKDSMTRFDRTLYFQWHRGDAPQEGRAFGAVGPRFKLVQAEGRDEAAKPFTPKYELFDLSQDPYEERDLSAARPETVEAMRRDYEAWFRDVGSAGFDPPRIRIGAPEENPTTLTMNDARGERSGHRPSDWGHWELEAAREGSYRVTLTPHPGEGDRNARLILRREAVSSEAPAPLADLTAPIPPNAIRVEFPPIHLPKGPVRLEAFVEEKEARSGARFVDVQLGGGSGDS